MCWGGGGTVSFGEILFSAQHPFSVGRTGNASLVLPGEGGVTPALLPSIYSRT